MVDASNHDMSDVGSSFGDPGEPMGEPMGCIDDALDVDPMARLEALGACLPPPLPGCLRWLDPDSRCD